MTSLALVLAALLLVAAPEARGQVAGLRAKGPQASPQTVSPPSGPPATAERAIEGSWSATGRRHTIAAEGDRLAEIVYLSGSVVLTTSAGISRGFRGEFIGYDDGVTGTVGRVAWTDQRGDHVFGECKGGPLHSGQELTVTLTGGTGRYEGITGELAIIWQYVVNAEDQAVQVRTTKLAGRYRGPWGTP